MAAYTTEYVFSGTAVPTTLASDATGGVSTTLSLTSATGWPAPTGGQKAIATLKYDTSQEVKITYTGKSGNDLTGVTWDYDGTTASGTYSAGTTIRHSISAEVINDYDKAKREIVGKATAANQIPVVSAANTYTMLAVAASRIVGRKASGDVDDMTTAELAALFGTADGTKFLADDGTLKTPGTASFVGCRLRNSADQSISTSTDTILAFDTEVLDVGGFHDNASNNSRITIPSGKGGKYLIHGAVQYAANTTGVRGLEIFKNGTRVGQNFAGAPAGTGFGFVTVTDVLSLAETDYVQLNVWQNSGGSLNVIGGGTNVLQPIFSAIYLGA